MEQPARVLNKDLKQAGIAKITSMGTLDFHASRVSYINILLDRGVGVREAQTLARHSTPQMTMNVYGRTRQKDLSEVISAMAKSVLGEKKRATCVQQPAAGSERQSATPSTTEGCASSNLAPAVGLEPHTEVSGEKAKPSQNNAKSKQFSALEQSTGKGDKQKNALSIQDQDISEHPKCATCVQQDFPEDLAVVVSAWDSLSTKVKDQIAVLIRKGF